MDSQSRILIVSTYFPPMRAVAAQRVLAFARYWTCAGKSVTVLTPARTWAEAGEAIDQEGYRVIRVPVPLVTTVRDLVRLRDQRGDHTGGGEGTRALAGAIWLAIGRRIKLLRSRTGAFYGARMPDVHDLWVGPALCRVAGEKWDAVVTTSGPYSSHFIGYILRRGGRAAVWLMDYRDLWSENHLFSGLPLVRQLESLLENKCGNYADLVTTVSEPLARILRRRFASKVHVVFNGFEEHEVASLPPQPAFSGSAKRIVYTGTIYPVQDPTPFLVAIASLARRGSLQQGELEVIFAGQDADVRELARSLGIEGFVSYHGELPREVALRYQRDADALLLLLVERSRSPRSEGVLTGKLFEYLGSGRPVLAVGNPGDNSVADLLARTGRGIFLGHDADAIEKIILRVVRGERLIPEDTDGTRAELARYSRRFQSQRMLCLLEGDI